MHHYQYLYSYIFIYDQSIYEEIMINISQIHFVQFISNDIRKYTSVPKPILNGLFISDWFK